MILQVLFTEGCYIFLGRMYLGMHSLIDIIGGLALGLVVLAIWLSVSEYIDSFVVSGQNGMDANSLHHFVPLNLSILLLASSFLTTSVYSYMLLGQPKFCVHV